GVALRSNEDRASGGGRQEDLWTHRRGHAASRAVAEVCGNTDHGIRSVAENEGRSKRIVAWPEGLRHLLCHDRDRGASLFRSKVAPFDQWHPQCLEQP